MFSPFADAAVSHVDARDIAAVAARVLVEEGHEGRVYPVTGPAALRAEEVAEQAGRGLRITLRVRPVPPQAAREGMVAGGMPVWYADGLVELFGAFDRGGAALVADTVTAITGRPATPVETFFADHRHHFKAGP
jgi:uncharacterized protein YbjT (DUF2867 family)